MKINVFKVKDNVGRLEPFRFTVSPDKIDVDKQLKIIGDIDIVGAVKNEGSILDVSGQVSANIKLICGRCLEEFTTKISAEFNEKYHYLDHNEDQHDFMYFSGEELDITDIVRESLLLAEPMKKICREDCKGFCPDCGINLNDSECSCSKKAIDPRLAVLQKLLKNQ